MTPTNIAKRAIERCKYLLSIPGAPAPADQHFRAPAPVLAHARHLVDELLSSVTKPGFECDAEGEENFSFVTGIMFAMGMVSLDEIAGLWADEGLPTEEPAAAAGTPVG